MPEYWPALLLTRRTTPPGNCLKKKTIYYRLLNSVCSRTTDTDLLLTPDAFYNTSFRTETFLLLRKSLNLSRNSAMTLGKTQVVMLLNRLMTADEPAHLNSPQSQSINQSTNRAINLSTNQSLRRPSARHSGPEPVYSCLELYPVSLHVNPS